MYLPAHQMLMGLMGEGVFPDTSLLAGPEHSHFYTAPPPTPLQEGALLPPLFQ